MDTTDGFCSNQVFVCKGNDAYATATEALKNLDFDPETLRGKRVLIKPNAGRLVEPGLGINTSPQVVAAVLDYFLDTGIENIAVAESPILGVNALESLEKSGIAEIARDRNVAVIDLDEMPPVTVTIPQWKVVEQLNICAEVTKADFIVSVPVMKTHMHTQVSLGLKNMKGCLYKREKVKLHQLPSSEKIPPPAKPLDMAIADLSKALLPDLTVIDGTIGQEGLGPSAGQPKQFGVVVASRSCLGADWVAIKLMGFDPKEVHHHVLAVSELNSRNSIPLFDENSINVHPTDFLKWQDPFQPPPKEISLEFPNLVVDDVDSCSACLSTVLMFLQRYHKGFADYFSEENPLRIAMGKGIGAQPENTLLIGNCTAHVRRDGSVFVKGCPPVASQILSKMKEKFEL